VGREQRSEIRDQGSGIVTARTRCNAVAISRPLWTAAGTAAFATEPATTQPKAGDPAPCRPEIGMQRTENGERSSPALVSSIQKSIILIRYSIKPLESHGRANRPGEPWIPPAAANSAPRGRVALPFVDDRPVQIESHEVMLRPAPFGSEIG